MVHKIFLMNGYFLVSVNTKNGKKFAQADTFLMFALAYREHSGLPNNFMAPIGFTCEIISKCNFIYFKIIRGGGGDPSEKITSSNPFTSLGLHI